MSTVVDLWTVQLIQDEATEMQWVHHDRMASLMREMEENLTELLPPEWRVRIRKWDQPDNEGNDDE